VKPKEKILSEIKGYELVLSYGLDSRVGNIVNTLGE